MPVIHGTYARVFFNDTDVSQWVRDFEVRAAVDEVVTTRLTILERPHMYQDEDGHLVLQFGERTKTIETGDRAIRLRP